VIEDLKFIVSGTFIGSLEKFTAGRHFLLIITSVFQALELSELHIVFKHTVKQKVNVGNMKKTAFNDGNKYFKKTFLFYPYNKILYT
jgi:hypothetical protein